MPKSHLTPYISDPVDAVKTIIASAKGDKEKVDGIHAGLGLADYGAVRLMDQDHPPMQGEAESCKSLSNTEIAKKLEAHCCNTDGSMKAIDWSSIWTTIKPLVFELLQRWLFS